MNNPDGYNKKVVDYGIAGKKTYLYRRTINGKPNASKKRTNYKDMSDYQKVLSDQRRTDEYKRKLYEVKRICEMNDFKLMLTLTVKEKTFISTNEEAFNREIQKFIQRLKYHLEDNNIRYFYTMEWQQREVLHCHMLISLEWIDFKLLEKTWGHGFVYISKENVGYLFKYVLKDVMTSIEQGVHYKHYWHISKNAYRPIVEKTLSNDVLEDVIFEHLSDDTSITDNSYNITHPYTGAVLNKVDVVDVRYKNKKKGK